jgi:hypothetical protein
LKSVEDALDDRVKKKADRYCKWGNFDLIWFDFFVKNY